VRSTHPYICSGQSIDGCLLTIRNYAAKHRAMREMKAHGLLPSDGFVTLLGWSRKIV